LWNPPSRSFPSSFPPPRGRGVPFFFFPLVWSEPPHFIRPFSLGEGNFGEPLFFFNPYAWFVFSLLIVRFGLFPTQNSGSFLLPLTILADLSPLFRILHSWAFFFSPSPNIFASWWDLLLSLYPPQPILYRLRCCDLFFPLYFFEGNMIFFFQVIGMRASLPPPSAVVRSPFFCKFGLALFSLEMDWVSFITPPRLASFFLFSFFLVFFGFFSFFYPPPMRPSYETPDFLWTFPFFWAFRGLIFFFF